MQIKKYRAATLQKAIEQVRADLGDGALILQADPLPNSNLGRNAVEVTAAIDKKHLIPSFKATVSEEVEERAALPQSTRSSKKSLLTGLFKRSKKAPSVSAPTAPVEEKVKKYAATQATNYAREDGDDTSSLSTGGATTGQFYAMKTMLEPLQKEISQIKQKLTEDKPQKNERTPSVALLETEIQSLKKTFQNYLTEKKFENSPIGEDVRKLVHFWREKGMSDRQVYAFLNQLREEGARFDQMSVEGHLRGFLSDRVTEGKSFESPKQRIVALVGPTGVGKTTSIAKLAAYEKLRLNRKVAFITIDDYKIGGTDQLAHYARILDVPFVKIRSDLSLEEQISHLSADTIFIDTFGASPRDERKIMALRRALRFDDPQLQARTEIHLTLPTHIQQGDVDGTLAAFSRLQPDYLFFTKWDETENWGGMLATILESKIPVSFVGNGQEVPDDISVFSAPQFVEQVLDYQN